MSQSCFCELRSVTKSAIIQWNPSTMHGHHWEPMFCPSGASGIFPLGMVLLNWAVEHNVAVLQSFLLLYTGREG